MESRRWDERYSGAGFAYGTEPNDFLASVADRLPPGPVLTLGEGEGERRLPGRPRDRLTAGTQHSRAPPAQERRHANANDSARHPSSGSQPAGTRAAILWAVVEWSGKKAGN